LTDYKYKYLCPESHKVVWIGDGEMILIMVHQHQL